MEKKKNGGSKRMVCGVVPQCNLSRIVELKY